MTILQSSPAVAFGRVYMGNTDGRVYSFGAHTGALAWATEYKRLHRSVSLSPGVRGRTPVRPRYTRGGRSAFRSGFKLGHLSPDCRGERVDIGFRRVP